MQRGERVIGDVRGPETDEAGLDRHARLEQPIGIGFGETQYELERLQQARGVKVGDAAASALSRLHKAEKMQPAQRLANHKPAYAKCAREFGLARQEVACPKVSRLDQFRELVGHPLGRNGAPGQRCKRAGSAHAEEPRSIVAATSLLRPAAGSRAGASTRNLIPLICAFPRSTSIIRVLSREPSRRVLKSYLD